MWQRAVLRVKAVHSNITGSCFVIDADCGLLWTCSHVVGEVVGQMCLIGMAAAPGQPIAWMYEARVVHSTPEQPGLDGALLWITARTPAASGVLPLHPLTHADGKPLPALPLGDDAALRLPGDEPAILLGYPGITQVMTPTVGIYSNLKDYGAHGGIFLLTDSTMLPGHSGGPGLNQRGEVVGWNVRQAEKAVRDPESFTVSYQDGSRAGHTLNIACGINELRPVSALLLELQGPAATALAKALGAAAPADARAYLAARPSCIAAGTHRFGPVAAAAFAADALAHADAAAVSAKAAQAAAAEASAAASTAQSAAANAVQPVQQAVRDLQLQNLMATQHHLLRNQLEKLQLLEKQNFQVGSLRLQLGEQAHSWVDFQSPQSPAMLQLAQLQASQPMPAVSTSPPTSRGSSPSRINADFGLVIDGDHPRFDEEAFKVRLAMLLRNEVTPTDISISHEKGRRHRSALVTTGSCEVVVNLIVLGSGIGRSGSDHSADEELDAEEERIEFILKGLISKEWPSGVDVTKITVKVNRRGSIILVLELPQPLPVLLMQLAKQCCPKLLEAVPGLLCCQLGGSVERLEGCEERHVETLAEAMEQAKRMIVPSEEATRGEPSDAVSEACTICGRQRSTCSYRDRQSFEPSIGAIVFAENHFAALGLSVEQAYAQGFASKVESAFRKRSRPVHPDKQQRRLSDLVPSDPEDEPVLPSGQEDKPVLLPVLEDEPAAEQESTLRPLEPAPESEPAPVHPPLTHLRCFNCCGFAPTDSAVSSCGLGVDAAPSGLGVDAAPSANATRSAGRLQEDLCSQRLQIRRTVPCQPLRILRPCRQSGIGRVRPQP